MKVLDVGGAQKAYKDATHILDVLPKPSGCKLDYTRMDVCSGKWPFESNEFDFVFCSNLLEDVKDPVHVCKEMMRVGKAGRIIVPNVAVECKVGTDTSYPHSDKYSGYIHHRWLCFLEKKGILFVPKTPMTHIYNWVKKVSNDDIYKNFFSVLEWEGGFEVKEMVYQDWKALYDVLKNHFKYDPAKGA